MSNNTHMIITCWEQDDVIADISRKTGIDFLKVSDGAKAGGPKVLIMEAYGACYRSLGEEKINEVIAAFKQADIEIPECASLIIDDDNLDRSWTVTRDP